MYELNKNNKPTISYIIYYLLVWMIFKLVLSLYKVSLQFLKILESIFFKTFELFSNYILENDFSYQAKCLKHLA